MESKDTKSIKNIKPLRKITNSQVIDRANNNKKENKPKEVITLKIMKKYMDPFQDQPTMKMKQGNGQSQVSPQNQNYQKQKN